MAVLLVCDFCGSITERKRLLTRQVETEESLGVEIICKDCEPYVAERDRYEKDLTAQFLAEQKERDAKFVEKMALDRIETVRSKRGLPPVEPDRNSPAPHAVSSSPIQPVRQGAPLVARKGKVRASAKG